MNRHTYSFMSISSQIEANSSNLCFNVTYGALLVLGTEEWNFGIIGYYILCMKDIQCFWKQDLHIR